jgi:pimeloyl-ACP methyl ester carboxylesterase
MGAALTWFPAEWENAVETIFRQPDVALAYEYLPGRAPVVVFLPGYASDMNGTKAIFLRNACAVAGHAMLRLDYAGHGQSGGRFTDGCIGDWTEDAAAIISAVCPDKSLILVGSSMGGWVALLLALRFSPAADAGAAGHAGPRGGAVPAQRLWRADADYAPAVRGWARPSAAQRADRHLLSGAHFARHERPGRALAAQHQAGRLPGNPACKADLDKGRRPPAVPRA